MSKITTHVLDTVLGKPAAGVAVRLELKQGDRWAAIATGTTDADGRCGDLVANATSGDYRLIFSTNAYLARTGRASIYPEILVTFRCDGTAHYHMPLLLSDNSYTTYRGS
ncbi:MAG: hydroxyisourate hydrolase [Terracidiphilus sp.]